MITLSAGERKKLVDAVMAKEGRSDRYESLIELLAKDALKEGKRYVFASSGCNELSAVANPYFKMGKYVGLDTEEFLFSIYQFVRDDKIIKRLGAEGKLGYVVFRKGKDKKMEGMALFDVTHPEIPLEFSVIEGRGREKAKSFGKEDIILIKEGEKAVLPVPSIDVIEKPAAPAKEEIVKELVRAAEIPSIEEKEDTEESSEYVTDDGVFKLPACKENDKAKRFQFYFDNGFMYEAYRIAHFMSLASSVDASIDGSIWSSKKLEVVAAWRRHLLEKEGLLDKYESKAMPNGAASAILEYLISFPYGNILFSGEKGVGKTTLIEDLPWVFGNTNGMIRLPSKRDMNFSDLVGGVKAEDGDTKFGEGGLCEALQRAKKGEYGVIVYFTEILELPEGILKSVNNFFSQREVDYTGRGEKIHVKLDPNKGERLWVFGDYNPKNGVPLGQDESGSVRDRFVELEFPWFTKVQLSDIFFSVKLENDEVKVTPSRKLCDAIANAFESLRNFAASNDAIKKPAVRQGKYLIQMVLANPLISVNQISASLLIPYMLETIRGDSQFDDLAAQIPKVWKIVLSIGETGADTVLDQPIKDIIPGAVKIQVKKLSGSA